MTDAAAPELSVLGEMVRRGDPDRFESALFAPESVRERLFTLYGYNLEAARAPWKVSEPHIGAMRLRFLLDMVEGAYAGSSPLAHEIGEPLHSLITDTMPPKPLFDQLVETRMRDLDPAPMESLEAFDAYIDDTAGALMRLATHVSLSHPERPISDTDRQLADAIAGDLGHAHGVASMLSALPELAARGRIMLPAMDATALDPAPLLRGETDRSWREAAAAVAVRGLKRLEAARRRRKSAPAEATPAFLAAWRTERILRQATRPTLDIVRDLGPESPFRRRASLLLRGLSGRW